MYMAISMASFGKEVLQGMCEEYILHLLHKVHGNIHGSFLLLSNFYITLQLQYMEISMDPFGIIFFN